MVLSKSRRMDLTRRQSGFIELVLLVLYIDRLADCASEIRCSRAWMRSKVGKPVRSREAT